MTRNWRLGWWAAASAALYVTLLMLVVTGWQPLHSFDNAALIPIHDWASERPWVVTAAEFVHLALHSYLVRVVLVLVALVLWWQRFRRTAVWLFVSVLVETAVVMLSKTLVGRGRPEWEDPIGVADGGSFPSGHAAGGALLAGVVIVVAILLVRSAALRIALYGVALALALVLGLDRLILGVHYPSDVLASYALIIAVLCTTAIATKGADTRSASTPALHGDRRG